MLQTLNLRAFLRVREGLLICSEENSLMEMSGSLRAERCFSSERVGNNFLEMYLLFCPSLFTLKLDVLFTAEASSVVEN